jgi:Zn-finger nucleic acid-binding protein
MEIFINKNNIEQCYNFYKNNYIDLTKKTIFNCITDFDYQLYNIHKGGKYIYINDINHFKYINNDTFYICEYNDIYNEIKKHTNNIIYLNSINIIQNKIVYLIVVKQNTERFKLLLEYLDNFNYNYYILIGDDEYNKNTVMNNYLIVNVKDIYENLPKKVYEGIKYIYYNTDYTHIYKVDDDFFKYNLNENIYEDYYGNYIVTKLTNNYHFGKCNNPELNTKHYTGKFYYKYAAGGYGYIISRKAMFFIINNKNYIYNEIYEDKAIGDILYNNNILINNNHYEHLNYKEMKINKKCAVILFHKNLKKIYKWRWINKCIKTILNQTYQNFDILEINYGGDTYSIMSEFEHNKNIYFYSKNYKTHTEAMTFLLNEGFYKYNYDIIFNTNLDDYYSLNRFCEQIKCINDGYILCSSFMKYITEKDNDDIITIEWDEKRYGFYGNDNYININQIKDQLKNDHNVINHSCICFTKDFWNSYDCNNNLLRYRDDKPFEDLSLWQRAVNNHSNITIINNYHIFYRLHENQIGEQNKKTTKDTNVDGGFKLEPSKDKSIIGIFLVATGKYIYYIEQLIKSIEELFLTDYKKCYIISTDNVKYVQDICNKYKIKNLIRFIYKKGFPLDTLYRYKYILEHDVNIELHCDFIYYLDVDMRIIENIGIEILPTKEQPLIGTYHPGFYYSKNKNGDVENNINSTAFINNKEFINKYIAGGFNGGYTREFLNMARNIQYNIDIDKCKDLMAVWHDESQLNRYMITNHNKFKFLTPDYCYPENYYQNIPGNAKILALDKDHHTVRNINNKKIILVNAVGGLGNLLFQFFYAYSIALRYNLEVVVNIDQNDESRESIYFYYLFDNIMRVKNIKDFYIIKESSKNYSNLINNIPLNKNIFLTGYFQSTLYFKDNFNRIKKNFNCSILNIAKNIFNKWNNNKNIIGLHIRGGDYIQKKNYHLLLNQDYYDKCLSYCDLNDTEIVLFTDDYKYAKNKYNYNIYIKDIINKYIEPEYEYMKNHPELEFFLLSLCNIIICANSTFSLWASYFSNANKVFIPKQWFGPDGPPDFTTDEFKLNTNYIII